MKIPKAFVALILSFMLFGTSMLGAVALAQSHTTPTATVQHGATPAPKAASPSTSPSPRSAACQADQQQGNDTGKEATQEKERASEAEATAEKENTAADPDNLQCGDQHEDTQSMTTNGAHALAAPHTGKVTLLRAQASTPATAQAENGNESGQAAEQDTTNDQATDGVVCEQQGQHDGTNAGC